MTVKKSTKTIIETSVALPLEVGATALEVTAEASQFVLNAVRGLMPATKAIGRSTVMLGYGMAYSDESEEQIRERVGRASLLSILESMEAGAIKTGQSFVKDWNEYEETTLNTDKKD
jgi:hypothetical protein